MMVLLCHLENSLAFDGDKSYRICVCQKTQRQCVFTQEAELANISHSCLQTGSSTEERINYEPSCRSKKG